MGLVTVITCQQLSTVINRGRGGLKENPPCTPLKEKGKKNTHISRARGVVFTTPTLDECKAIIEAGPAPKSSGKRTRARKQQ